jgi:hypothetical protein
MIKGHEFVSGIKKRRSIYTGTILVGKLSRRRQNRYKKIRLIRFCVDLLDPTLSG